MDSNDYSVEHLLSLLKPSKLETPAQMAVQLAACAEVFGFVDVGALLTSLFEQDDASHILALLVSSCHAETISEWLLEHFPGDRHQELAYNVSFQALSMLSWTVVSLMHASVSPEIIRNHYLTAVAPQLLSELLAYDSTAVAPESHDRNDSKRLAFRIRQMTQQRQEWQRHSAQVLLSPLLKRHLLDLGLPTPVYQSDLGGIFQTIMKRLQGAMALIIHELKQDATSLGIRGLFVKPSTLERLNLHVGFNAFQRTVLVDKTAVAHKNIEAAKIHLNEGRVLQAAKLLFKDPRDRQSIQLGVEFVTSALWKCVTFGGGWKKDDSLGHELLGLLNTVNFSLLDPGPKDEIAMFRAFAHNPFTHLEFRRLGRAFAASSNLPASLLCFDSLFINPIQIDAIRGFEVTEIINDFLCYARILRKVVLHPSPQNEEGFQKLFGFIPHSLTHFLVFKGTTLHTLIETSRSSAAPLEYIDGDVVVSGNILCSTLRNFLRLRLINRIKSEHQVCRAAETPYPCLLFTLQGQCVRPKCKRQHVTNRTATRLYRGRVRLHMQQLLILQIWHLEDPQDHDVPRYLEEWVDPLYRSMFPPHPFFGVFSDLDIQGIPEFNATVNILRTVSRKIMYREVPTESSHTIPGLITRFMQIAFCGFTFDAIEASAYVERAACWTAPKPPMFVREGNTFIIKDLFFSYMGKPKSLADGLSLIMHVVNTKMCIDVQTFCDYIERQVALFCATQTWNSSTSLHGLTLPRSWMVYLLQSNTHTSLHDMAQETQTSLKSLVDSLIQLTSDVYTQYLFYLNPDKSLSQYGIIVVSNFVSRLFRVISYLVYNSRFIDVSIQQAVLRLFQSFPKTHNSFSSSPIIKFLVSYASIQDWAGVVRLIQQSPFKADVTIELQHSSHVAYSFPLAGIQTITFTTLDDALVQVSRSASSLKELASNLELSQNQPTPLQQHMRPGIGVKADQGKDERRAA